MQPARQEGQPGCEALHNGAEGLQKLYKDLQTRYEGLRNLYEDLRNDDEGLQMRYEGLQKPCEGLQTSYEGSREGYRGLQEPSGADLAGVSPVSPSKEGCSSSPPFRGSTPKGGGGALRIVPEKGKL